MSTPPAKIILVIWKMATNDKEKIREFSDLRRLQLPTRLEISNFRSDVDASTSINRINQNSENVNPSGENNSRTSGQRASTTIFLLLLLELSVRRFAWRRWLAVPLESLTYSCLTSPLRSIINACVSFSANACINITSFDVATPVRHLNTPHCQYKVCHTFCQAKHESLTISWCDYVDTVTHFYGHYFANIYFKARQNTINIKTYLTG